MQTHIFKVKLLDNKKIWREIEIPENRSLYKFAEAITKAFDFYFDHCFGFFSKVTTYESFFDSEEKYELFTDLEDEGIEPTGAGSVKKTKIKEVWKEKKKKMMFYFDYGDDWRFEVELVDFGEFKKEQKYPKFLRKQGKAPEQYPTYEE
jgi:hypothetical protein